MKDAPRSWRCERRLSIPWAPVNNIYGADGELVAVVLSSDDDACLVTTAPKLLEACKDAHLTLQSVKHLLHDHELDSIEYLVLAIAEATGE